jgi:hypothetical protein
MEQDTPGAYTSDSGQEISAFDGRKHPQITLEFPIVTKRGETLRVTVQGANYRIQISGGVTVLIPREVYRKKFDRLPKEKTSASMGDMVTAVFYKYKDGKELNYKLKSFHLDTAQ